MSENEVKNNTNKQDQKDDAVIISMVSLGVVGGIGLLFLCVPPATSAFLFSLAGSAMLYRFLGGTTGNSFELRGVKTTASAAILFAGTLGLNFLLEKQLNDSDFTPKSCMKFTPDSSNWVPFSISNGKPIAVKIGGTKIENPELTSLKNDLSLNANGEVVNDNFPVGRISLDELSKSVSIAIKFDNVFTSDPLEANNLFEFQNLPFNVKVLRIQNSPRRKVSFQLLRNGSNEVIGEDIQRSERIINLKDSDPFQVFQLDGAWYFITASTYCPEDSCQPSSVTFVAGKITQKMNFSPSRSLK